MLPKTVCSVITFLHTAVASLQKNTLILTCVSAAQSSVVLRHEHFDFVVCEAKRRAFLSGKDFAYLETRAA
jgi:hypothetical protein